MMPYALGTFAPVVMHIGKEIARVLEDRGMPKTVFAERIGRTPKNVGELLDRPGIDTMLLVKVSKVLKYNFFTQLSDEVEPRPAGNMVSDSTPQYRRSNRPPVRLVIEVDPDDPAAKKEAEAMAARLLNSRRSKKG